MAFARAVARVTLPIALVLGVLLSNVGPAAAASTPVTEYSKVFDLAKTKLGARWVQSATGPTKFDCVGFVWFIFHENDLQSHIGGYRGVKAYYDWFRDRGLVARDNPQLGDLVIWGDFHHIGMYVGDGNAISALVQPWGVKIHPVSGWINQKFKYYLHTNLTH